MPDWFPGDAQRLDVRESVAEFRRHLSEPLEGDAQAPDVRVERQAPAGRDAAQPLIIHQPLAGIRWVLVSPAAHAGPICHGVDLVDVLVLDRAILDEAR